MAPSPRPMGQAAWLNHIFDGQQDFRRKPTAPPAQTPAQKGSQTRTRNAARARAASVPDYAPEMQGSGNTAQKIRRIKTPLPQAPRMNTTTVLRGGRASATGATAPRPPIRVRVPGIPEGGINVTRPVESAAKSVATGAAKGVGGTVLGKVLKATKIGVPVVGVASFLADADRAEGSPTSDQAMARRTGRLALDYIKEQKRGADKTGNAAQIPLDIYNRAVNYQRRVNRGQVNGVKPAVAPAPKPRTTAPAAKISRMVDYGAAPKSGGKFLHKAYLYNKTRANMVSAGAVKDRAVSYGVSGDVLPSPKTDRQLATAKFKATHVWARNPKRAADLNQAVTYLANTKHRGYFSA